LGFGKLVGVETPTGLKPRENGSRGSIVRKCVPAGPKGTLRHFFRESRETASVDPDLHFLGNRPAECSSRLKLHHHDSTEMNSLPEPAEPIQWNSGISHYLFNKKRFSYS
jgi:hypothetical protein